MKVKNLLIALTLGFAFLFWTNNTANAVIVSPVVVEHELAPGMTIEGKLRVSNEDGDRHTYYTVIQKFVPRGENGEQEYLPEDEASGLPGWFSAPDAITVAAHSSEEVEYTINAPVNAEPGGHYAAVFFTTTPPNMQGSTGVGLTSKTGIIFLVKISGDIVEDAKVESFTSNQKVFSHLPAMMSLRLRNTGNVHFRPHGTLEIRNMWGGIVARLPANPSAGAVLPNSIRRINTWWAKSNEVAQGGFIAGLTNEWRNFALGKYTATVNVKYGSQNKTLEQKTTSFWVIPWRMGIILLIILGILYLVMRLYNKTIVNAALKKTSVKKKK